VTYSVVDGIKTAPGPAIKEHNSPLRALDAPIAGGGSMRSAAARGFVKKMRGGTQAHLLAASDGHAYVTKFTDNPQHRRVLVNEWICADILKCLSIATPACVAIDLSEQFLAAHPALGIELAHGRLPVSPGLHFGSRFPGVPDKTAVYDFLPGRLFSEVSNRDHFIGLLVVDKWLGNTDSRQALFVRERPPGRPDNSNIADRRKRLVALAVDHGYAFGGRFWEFGDSPLHGIYAEPQAYVDLRSIDDVEPWLRRIEAIPDRVFTGILRGIPNAWIGEDATCLEVLVERLLRRRSRLADLVLASIRALPDRFPSWMDSRVVGGGFLGDA